MIFTQAQQIDDAILSERNVEQELYQGEDPDYDIDDEDQDSEQEIEAAMDDEKKSHSFSANSQTINDKKTQEKEKEIKETCLEKLKGYLGFGSLLTSQKIGNVFLIPIPTTWTFKMQVIVTQLIISVVSLGVFFAIRFGGQAIFQQNVRTWSANNFEKLQLQQIQQLTQQYLEIINVTQYNEYLFVQIANEVFQQTDITYPLCIMMNQPLQNATTISSGNPYFTLTLNYSTYSYLNNTVVENISQYMAANYMLRYNYITLSANFYWVFSNGLFIQYPGMNTTILPQYQANIRKIDSEQLVTKSFIYDNFSQSYVHRNAYSIKNISDNSILGTAYVEKRPKDYMNLFYTFANSTMLNYSFIILTTDKVLIRSSWGRDNPQQFMNWKPDEVISSTNTYTIYKRILNGTINTVSVMNGSFLTILVYNFTLLEQQLAQQDQDFSEYDQQFNERYLAACLGAPILYIVCVVIFLIRQIRPLEQITERADLSLKKSQAMDDQPQYSGDGLIGKLTELFKQLMHNLNEMKLKKKQEIIAYYNRQSYPENAKEKDVSAILKEIEKIKDVKNDKLFEVPDLIGD